MGESKCSECSGAVEERGEVGRDAGDFLGSRVGRGGRQVIGMSPNRGDGDRGPAGDFMTELIQNDNDGFALTYLSPTTLNNTSPLHLYPKQPPCLKIRGSKSKTANFGEEKASVQPQMWAAVRFAFPTESHSRRYQSKAKRSAFKLTSCNGTKKKRKEHAPNAP
jgi:hypothetical protein